MAHKSYGICVCTFYLSNHLQPDEYEKLGSYALIGLPDDQYPTRCESYGQHAGGLWQPKQTRSVICDTVAVMPCNVQQRNKHPPYPHAELQHRAGCHAGQRPLPHARSPETHVIICACLCTPEGMLRMVHSRQNTRLSLVVVTLAVARLVSMLLWPWVHQVGWMHACASLGSCNVSVGDGHCVFS